MIIIALGANLDHPQYGKPVSTLEMALTMLARAGVKILRKSSWYGTAPVPVSDQPWFINGVVQVETDLKPASLLALLHKIEKSFGRVRNEKWGARILDLDLIAYDDLVTENTDQQQGLVIPHPFAVSRAFVLIPLEEILPKWSDPRSGKGIRSLSVQLPADQQIKKLS